MPTDQEIIVAIKEDSQRGFGLLMASYMKPVYWHIRRMVVAHADAQDVMQETFVRVFRSFDYYQEDQPLNAWIFGIATNEALRFLGKSKGKSLLSLEDTSEDLFSLKADDYVDYSDVEAVKLQKAILSLPAKQQIAFNLRYYNELSYDDIALITGSTATNVKANYHNAKEKIVNYMKSND
jgi:RNA polymerase sigma-70 factor (ECF subfamily)